MSNYIGKMRAWHSLTSAYVYWNVTKITNPLSELPITLPPVGELSNFTLIEIKSPIALVPVGIPEDGYVPTWSSVDGYYIPKMQGIPAFSIIYPTMTTYLKKSDYFIAVGSLGSSITLYLPATPSIGEQHIIKDATGSATSFNIIVDGYGHNIDASSTYTISSNWTSSSFMYTGTRWNIF